MPESSDEDGRHKKKKKDRKDKKKEKDRKSAVPSSSPSRSVQRKGKTDSDRRVSSTVSPLKEKLSVEFEGMGAMETQQHFLQSAPHLTVTTKDEAAAFKSSLGDTYDRVCMKAEVWLESNVPAVFAEIESLILPEDIKASTMLKVRGDSQVSNWGSSSSSTQRSVATMPPLMAPPYTANADISASQRINDLSTPNGMVAVDPIAPGLGNTAVGLATQPATYLGPQIAARASMDLASFTTDTALNLTGAIVSQAKMGIGHVKPPNSPEESQQLLLRVTQALQSALARLSQLERYQLTRCILVKPRQSGASWDVHNNTLRMLRGLDGVVAYSEYDQPQWLLLKSQSVFKEKIEPAVPESLRAILITPSEVRAQNDTAADLKRWILRNGQQPTGAKLEGGQLQVGWAFRMRAIGDLQDSVSLELSFVGKSGPESHVVAAIQFHHNDLRIRAYVRSDVLKEINIDANALIQAPDQRTWMYQVEWNMTQQSLPYLGKFGAKHMITIQRKLAKGKGKGY